MDAPLSSITDNFSEINKQNKNVKDAMNNAYMTHKKKTLIYRCEKCNNKSYKSTNRLIAKFLNTYQFCLGDKVKFVLLVRKGVYSIEYMDSWEKFDEDTLSSKKEFYRSIHLEGITDNEY